MPTKKSGAGERTGRGSRVADLTLEILREIRDEIRGTNERLERVEREVAQLRGRFEHFLETAGQVQQDHERRIRTLEERAFGGAR